VKTDPSKLSAILDRLEAGNPLKPEDLEILVAGLTTRQITMATGKSAVALGTSADNATITSGDRNIVIPKEIARLLQDNMRGNIDFHSGDRVTNNYYFLNPDRLDSAEQQKLPQLIEILKSIDLEVLQQIYLELLPVDAELWGSSSVDIDRVSIVSNLNNLRLLQTFIERLIDDERLPEKDRESLKLIFPRSKANTRVQIDRNHILESYLSIVIRPSATNLNKFSVDGWLTANNIEDSSFSPLDLDATAKGIACALDEMPAIFNDFLDLSLEKLKGRMYELTIEIFLPMNLLCADVDRWIIRDLDEDLPVGTRYRTIVRTSDRLSQRYLIKRWSEWQINWRRVKDSGNLNPSADDFETIDCCVSCNWKQVVNNLSSKLGLKLTCGLMEAQEQNFFKTIWSAATPIAIWVRSDLPDLDLPTEINNLITGSPLLKLSAAVLEQRRHAHSQELTERHLGAHLGMLWEDPHRLTPDVKEWLLTPGQ
jgi:hypothetical protein